MAVYPEREALHEVQHEPGGLGLDGGKHCAAQHQWKYLFNYTFFYTTLTCSNQDMLIKIRAFNLQIMARLAFFVIFLEFMP